LDDPQSSEREELFHQRINDLESRLCSQYQKTQLRVVNIGQAVAKLAAGVAVNQSGEAVRKLTNDVDSQTRQIGELRRQLESLRDQIKTSDVRENVSVKEREREPLEVREEGPDLEAPLREVRDNINEFREDFARTMGELQKRADFYDGKIRELTIVAGDLVQSVKGLGDRAREADGISQELLRRVNDLEKKVGDRSSQGMIETLSAQLKLAHENLRSEIDRIRDRIRKCESAIPLVAPVSGS
jgi:SMC interacting uncharacterized protein involved in chromosome segregation